MSRFDLVGFGEAMVLFQPDGALRTATHATVHVAGAELNLCAAAARAGLRTAYCSRVGADPLGEKVLDHAASFGIATDLVTTDADRPTGLFLKDVRPDGVRRVHYYRRGSAASALSTQDVQRALAARPRMVAVSGITSALSDSAREAVRTLLAQARAFGVQVAYDPNLRPALGDLDAQIAEARDLLPHVSMLLIGADEAEPLFGTSDPAAVFRAARAAGVAETVLKAGPEGCWYADGDAPAHLPSAATSVVDPVGAGDAFAGAYLAGRARGANPAGAAWLAGQFAAAIVARPGDTDGLPSAAEAEALVAAALRAPSR
ncbi:MAG: sugar kinase [Hamadaea sp.]|uniref:sugar kinase n=1 Tax=Hamadaea sp. TaxID=2024425 RepID=UPI0017B9F028|nr:sugar kinase [Hamadaea sp.]NUR72306.1 sugar kinase [Hamadaea sp.]NUT18718.1 sugar kinase [Hamadaea sp.]